MLRVLRHYLPLRKALLVFSETLLLAVVIAAGMTAHLIRPEIVTLNRIHVMGFGRDDALLRCLISSFLLSLIAQLAIAFNELYDYRISSSRFDRAGRFVGSAGSAVALGLSAFLLARAWHLEAVLDFPGMGVSQVVQTLVLTMVVGFGVLYFWRNVFHFALRRWHYSERVLILGAGDPARALAADMAERPYSGYEAVGLVPEDSLVPRGPRLRIAGEEGDPEGRTADHPGTLAPAEAGPKGALLAPAPRIVVEPVLEPLTSRGRAERPEPQPESLFELVQRMRVDLVVVALENRRGRLPTEELLRCRLAGISVREHEEIYERLTGKIAVEALRPSYLIFNEGFVRSPWGELAKRALDLVLSLVGIALTWPIMLAVAIAVRLDTAGPALFRQERIGRDGESFTLLKFRSMRADAEQRSGPVWAATDDPRITRVGRFIRRARLDELPQLFNILAGDMALVGPRPERPVFVEELVAQIPYFGQRHIVKPGLTGWAQINYRYGNTIEDALQKLQYDLFYIKYQSLLFDLSIVFNTIKTVILRKGT